MVTTSRHDKMSNGDIRMEGHAAGLRDGLAGKPYRKPDSCSYYVEGYSRGHRSGEKLAAISAYHRGQATYEQLMLIFPR